VTTGMSLEEQVCVVDEVQGEALQNGTTYIFFVVAVMGSDMNKISWTSNFVTDTPATQVFSGELTIKADMMYHVDASKLGAAGNAISLYGDNWLALADINPITAADFKEEACKDGAD